MTLADTADRLGRAVKGDFALGVTRVMIAGGLPILLMLAGYTSTRLINQLDAQGARIEAQGAKTQDKLEALARSLGEQSSMTSMLQSTVNLRGIQRDQQVNEIKAGWQDHETRIRILERPHGLSGPR